MSGPGDTDTHGFPRLPCYPCPHQSACCAWGTTLTSQEARRIRASHLGDRIYRTRWGEWRTRVRKGRCAFLENNACTIYHTPHYPTVCRTFPWTDAEYGGPYEFDQTICPEFVRRPELVQMGLARHHAKGSGEREAASGKPGKGTASP